MCVAVEACGLCSLLAACCYLQLQARCTHFSHVLQMLPVQEGKMVLRLFRILFEMLSKLPPARPEEQQPLEVVLAPRFTTLVDTLLKQMIDAEVSLC